ncbi:MAG: PLP-dependent aminotransferase family protein [Myxococcota bacterium]
MQIELKRGAADTNAGEPLYRQIAGAIRGRVERGELNPGERLPAIRELARELAVNRNTVSLAYETLAAAGVVESTVGRGTFVRRASSPESSLREALEPTLSPLAERLLHFERSRPRFGSGGDAIPMHSVVPGPDLYPVEAFRKVMNRTLARGGAKLFTYGDPQGQPRLRELLAERLQRAGIGVSPQEILLCHGASQGIALALRLFTSPGDTVALEEPTYNNALAATLALDLHTAAVPMRDGAVDLEALERCLSRPEVKAFYTIPTFHNPLGTSTSLAHRKAVLAIATRAGVPVIEDGYEMDLRYAGRPVPPLAALDESGLVIHLFSFSKSLFPGTRIGAVSARGRCVGGLLALKQATDLSDSLPLQAALAAFLESGEYDRHLGRIGRLLRGRRDAVLAALEREMPPGCHWTRPEGGYQIWLQCPEGIDSSELLPDATAAGVLFAPGSQFHHDARASSAMRLSISMADAPQLERGVERLAHCVRECLTQAPRMSSAVHV